ncbi:MAG: porin [Burkholderiales bacterium]|nr:porin [Burkholderiales bacterium]
MREKYMNARVGLMTCCVIILATTNTGVLAQSGVTLYGNVDGGVMFSDSGVSGGSLTSLASAGFGSFWGLRGTEDLGRGYRTLFQLESGIDISTGSSISFNGDYNSATPTAPNGPTITGFNRRAYIGLDSPYGMVQLGRDYTPLFYAAAASDTMRLQYFGNLQATLQITGGVERMARVSNGIFYTSPVMGGLKIRAAYSFGSESTGQGAGPPRNGNEFIGIGAEYVNGGLTVVGSVQRLKLPLTAGAPLVFTNLHRREDALIGIRYRTGNFTFTAGHFRIGSPIKGSNTWLGASAIFGPSTLYLQVQQLKQKIPSLQDRHGTAVGIAFDYALSRRTVLYAAYGITSNNATGRFAVIGSDVAVAPGAVGATPRAVAFGVRHSF